MQSKFILYSVILFSTLWMGVPCNAAGNKPPRPEIKGKGRNGKPLGRGQSYHDLPPGTFVKHLVRRGQRNINQRLGIRTNTPSEDVFKIPEMEEGLLGSSQPGGFTLGKPKATTTSVPELSPKSSRLQKLRDRLTGITSKSKASTSEKPPTDNTLKKKNNTPFDIYQTGQIQQPQNQKSEIEQIVDTFDNKLDLSEEIKMTLENFIEGEIHPKITKIARRLRQLANTTHNISEKELQIIVWYIESYMQYKITHNKSDLDSDREIALNENLEHLIVQANSGTNSISELNLLYEIYGVATGHHIVLREKTKKTIDYLQKWPPTITEIHAAIKNQSLADTLMAFIGETSLIEKKDKLIEAMTRYPNIRKGLANLVFYIGSDLRVMTSESGLIPPTSASIIHDPPLYRNWSPETITPHYKSRVKYFIELATGPDAYLFDKELSELIPIRRDFLEANR